MTRRLFSLMAVSLCLAASTAFGQQDEVAPNDTLDLPEPLTTAPAVPERTPTGYTVSWRQLAEPDRMDKSWTSADSSHSVTISGASDDGTGDLDTSQAVLITEEHRRQVQIGQRQRRRFLFGHRSEPIYATMVTRTVSEREFREPVEVYTQNWPRKLISRTPQPPTGWQTSCTDEMIKDGAMISRHTTPCDPRQPDWAYVTGTHQFTHVTP